MLRLFFGLRRCAGIALILGAMSLTLPAPAFAQEMSAATKKLFDAVHNGDLSQVQISIAGGADINAVNTWGVTPVDLAVDKGHFNIVHFLLQVRELKKTTKRTPPAPATITPLGGAPVTTVIAKPVSPLQPSPAAAPVGEVYSPPPEAGPWSATVVKSTPPVPPPPTLPEGPSPFDKGTPVAQSSIPIIGAVRGPAAKQPVIDTSVQTAVEETFQKVVKQPAPDVKSLPVIKPEPKATTAPIPAAATKKAKPAPKKAKPVPVTETAEAKDDEGGVWKNIKSFLNLDSEPEKESPTTPVAESKKTAKTPAPMKPVVEARKSTPLPKPTAPVSPPIPEPTAMKSTSKSHLLCFVVMLLFPFGYTSSDHGRISLPLFV